MKKILIYSLITLILMPISLKAADSYTLLEPLPCIDSTTKNCVADPTGKSTDQVVVNMSLEDYIGYIFKFAIALAAFLAVIVIIYGGFEYMTSDSISNKNDAKEKFKNAATGLLMVLASYLILRTIDPRLVEINTNIQPIKIDTSGVTAMKTQLDADLSAMTTQSIKDSAAIQSIIDQKQQQITDFENTHAGYNGGYNGDPATDQEIAAYEALKQDVSTLKKQQALVIADGTAANQSKIIMNPVIGDSTAQSQAAINIINKNYDAAIGLLNKQTDADTIAELNKRKAFYDESITFENKVLSNGTKNYISGGTISGTTFVTVDNTAYLQGKLTEYQTALDQVAKNNTITDTTYATVLKARIDQINKVLKKK